MAGVFGMCGMGALTEIFLSCPVSCFGIGVSRFGRELHATRHCDTKKGMSDFSDIPCAESMGFEPTHRDHRPSAFRVRPLEPLG